MWFRFLSIDLLSGVAWKWKNLLLNLHWSEIDAPKMDTHPHLTPQRPIYEMHVAKSYRSKSNHEKITINSGKLISIDFTLAGNAFLRFNQFRKKNEKNFSLGDKFPNALPTAYLIKCFCTWENCKVETSRQVAKSRQVHPAQNRSIAKSRKTMNRLDPNFWSRF